MSVSRDRKSMNNRSKKAPPGRRRSKKVSSVDAANAVECLTESTLPVSALKGRLDQAEYIVFDIETTGGNPIHNGITEIFAIKCKADGKVLDTFYSMVNPKVPIPPIVRRMTGITDKMVAGQPLIEEVMPGFIEFAGNAIFVSHNTIGDLRFLRYFAAVECKHRLNNFFLLHSLAS